MRRPRDGQSCACPSPEHHLLDFSSWSPYVEAESSEMISKRSSVWIGAVVGTGCCRHEAVDTRLGRPVAWGVPRSGLARRGPRNGPALNQAGNITDRRSSAFLGGAVATVGTHRIAARPRNYTVPVQCPHSARTMPVQCPLGIPTVPVLYARRKNTVATMALFDAHIYGHCGNS